MRNNLGNPRRIESFKKAIEKRIQNKFEIDKKRKKLKNMLELEGRRQF